MKVTKAAFFKPVQFVPEHKQIQRYIIMDVLKNEVVWSSEVYEDALQWNKAVSNTLGITTSLITVTVSL